MKKRILAYRKGIDQILKSSGEITDWDELLKEHIQQINFFQHERLVHLIVTMTFAILTLMSIGFMVITDRLAFIILTVILLALLIPYIKHYYLLENEVQTMYEQYDRILFNLKETERSFFQQVTHEPE